MNIEKRDLTVREFKLLSHWMNLLGFDMAIKGRGNGTFKIIFEKEVKR